jgi:SulP family sulfate permease
MIEGLAHKAHKRGVALWLTGANRDIVRLFLTHGLKKPLVKYTSTVEGAISSFRNGNMAERQAA